MKSGVPRQLPPILKVWIVLLTTISHGVNGKLRSHGKPSRKEHRKKQKNKSLSVLWKIPWETIQKRAQEKAEKQESLRSLEIIRKAQSGASLELQVMMDTISFNVEGEYAIREFLSPKGCSVTGKDGTVIRKAQSGASLELQVMMDTISFNVEGEYAIREFLSPKGCSVTGKDGTVTAGGALLPSSYFSMEILPGEKVLLKGGGYGHGVGMSQNAANEMAKEGYTFHEILDYFFRDVSIESCI